MHGLRLSREGMQIHFFFSLCAGHGMYKNFVDCPFKSYENFFQELSLNPLPATTSGSCYNNVSSTSCF